MDADHVFRFPCSPGVACFTRCCADVTIAVIGRAAVSIPANIAEAYGLGAAAQLVRGLRIAYGSAAELQTLLWFASG